MRKILFVCFENAGRRQMAEAFANKYGKGKFNADVPILMRSPRYLQRNQ